jgi:S-adenosylmethionine:tRNA-ribosyltransferase-isomerase (queuine synthetase)
MKQHYNYTDLINYLNKSTLLIYNKTKYDLKKYVFK